MLHCPCWQPREKVHVGFRGRQVDAWVGLASRDSHRLMLEFRTILGIYVCTMPVVWHDGVYRDLIEDEVVVIERRVRCAAVSFSLPPPDEAKEHEFPVPAA